MPQPGRHLIPLRRRSGHKFVLQRRGARLLRRELRAQELQAAAHVRLPPRRLRVRQLRARRHLYKNHGCSPFKIVHTFR